MTYSSPAWRRFSGWLAVVLIGAGVAPPRTRAAEDPKVAADRYVQFAQAVRDQVLTPASCPFSPASIVLAVGTDPQKLADFVRKQVAYEPYPGVVRGAEGTLAAKAGGDWDRALLLQALLKEAGYKSTLKVLPRTAEESAAVLDAFLKQPPVIRSWYAGVNGGIDQQQFGPPIALLQQFGLSPDNRKIYGLHEAARLRRLREESLLAAAHAAPLLDQALSAGSIKAGQSFDAWRKQLLAGAADRVIVEYKTDKGATILSTGPDSAAPDASRLSSAQSIEQVSPDKTARLSVRLELSVGEEGKPPGEPIVLLDRELPLAELFRRPMRLEIVPSDDAASAKPVASWAPADWYRFVSEFKNYQAILRIGDEWDASKVFDTQGNIHEISSDGRVEAASKVGGSVTSGFGGFGGLAGGGTPQQAKPKTSIDSLILKMTLQMPGGQPQVQQRLICGRLRPGITPIFTGDLLATAAPTSAHAVTWMLLDAITRNAPLAARITTENDPRRFEQTQGTARLPMLLLDWQTVRLLAAQQLAAEGSGLTYLGGPSIVMHATSLAADPSAKSVMTRHAMDVVLDDGLLVPTSAQSADRAAQANVALGVAATVAESALLRAIDPAGGASGAYSALEESLAGGAKPQAVAPGADAAAAVHPAPLAGWSFSRNEPGRALVIAAPQGAAAWWSIDPTTGRTIGRGGGGEGQSASEYLQVTKKNLENLKCMVGMSNQLISGAKRGAVAQAWIMCETGTDNSGNGNGVPGAVEGWMDPDEKVLDIGIGPLADALGGAKDLYDIMNQNDPILNTGR